MMHKPSVMPPCCWPASFRYRCWPTPTFTSPTTARSGPAGDPPERLRPAAGRQPVASAQNRAGPLGERHGAQFQSLRGVKAGKSYLFETRVTTPGGDTYRLNQKMEAPGGTAPCNTAARPRQTTPAGRAIAPFTAWTGRRSWPSPPSSLAATTICTTCSLRHKKLEQPEPAESKLKVASYNVWALPVIASSIGERLALLPEYLRVMTPCCCRRCSMAAARASCRHWPRSIRTRPGCSTSRGQHPRRRRGNRQPLPHSARGPAGLSPVHWHRLLRRQGGHVCGGDQGARPGTCSPPTPPASTPTRRAGCARSSSARSAPWPPA